MIRRIDYPVTLLLCGLGVALACAPPSLADWLVADSARIRGGELWRLLTGPLVHATLGHMLRDVALCFLVGAVYEAPLRRLWPVLALATLVVPTLAIVVFSPDLAGYYGLSGMSHGWIAAALTYELGRDQPRLRGLVYLAALGLVAKVLYEVAAGTPLFPMSLGPAVRQVPIAHAAGVLAGVAVALGAGRDRGWRVRRSMASICTRPRLRGDGQRPIRVPSRENAMRRRMGSATLD